MATKSSVAIPNGRLYNYNPFTNIMPPNESWVYYKYTTTNVNLNHDISQELNSLENGDIFVLYAGSGGKGGYSVLQQTVWMASGGGGCTGEINLKKININDIQDKKINFKINNYFYAGVTKKWTTISYMNNNINNSFDAYGSLNNSNNIDANYNDQNFILYSGSGENSCIYNLTDRPLDSIAYTNLTMYFGSAGGYAGNVINNVYNFSLPITYGKNGISTLLDDNSNQLYNTTNINYVNVNFSNNLLKSDNSGKAKVLEGGKSAGANYNSTTNVYSFDGPPGFVMIFYKLKPNAYTKTIINTNLTQTTYNPLNSFLPSFSKKYTYYLYNNSTINQTKFIHTVNNIAPNETGNKIVNILFVGGGGIGGGGGSGKGGGGGGGGGEVCLINVDYNRLLNGQVVLTVGNAGQNSQISNIDNTTTSYIANAGKNGNDGTKNGTPTGPKGNGGKGGDGLAIDASLNNTNSLGYCNVTYYGSGSGGGGGGYSSNSNSNASPGTIQTGVNYGVDGGSTSSKAPRYVTINDIGDLTGPVNVSCGGWGGSGEKSGSNGNKGFVLIYYLTN